jgi:hypothetical protein
MEPVLAPREGQVREGVLHEEREIILGLDASPEVRAVLLAVAFTIGACYFPGEVLESVFRQELPLIKGSDMIQEWVTEGEARGEVRRARAIVLRLLSDRFGSSRRTGPITLISRTQTGVKRGWFGQPRRRLCRSSACNAIQGVRSR